MLRHLHIWAIVASAMIGFSACATQRPFNDIKLIGFDEDVSKGKPAGPIEGKDCATMVLGYGKQSPSLQKALSAVQLGKYGSDKGEPVRYVNNVKYSHDGLNVGVYSKNCLVVAAKGYR